MSLEDYDWINQKPWKPFDKRKPPSWMKLADGSTDDKGDIYLEPSELRRAHVFHKKHITYNLTSI